MWMESPSCTISQKTNRLSWVESNMTQGDRPRNQLVRVFVLLFYLFLINHARLRSNIIVNMGKEETVKVKVGMPWPTLVEIRAKLPTLHHIGMESKALRSPRRRPYHCAQKPGTREQTHHTLMPNLTPKFRRPCQRRKRHQLRMMGTVILYFQKVTFHNLIVM